jgi:hypothetical protein
VHAKNARRRQRWGSWRASRLCEAAGNGSPEDAGRPEQSLSFLGAGAGRPAGWGRGGTEKGCCRARALLRQFSSLFSVKTKLTSAVQYRNMLLMMGNSNSCWLVSGCQDFSQDHPQVPRTPSKVSFQCWNRNISAGFFLSCHPFSWT